MGTSRGLQQPHQSRWHRGWIAMPYSSTSKKMDHQTLLSKAASLAWSTHIMQSGEYDHQTTS
eukprot:4232102-Amphidinium_carterae.1